MKTKTIKRLVLTAFLPILMLGACAEQKKEEPKEEPPHEMEQEMVDAPNGIISLKKAKILCDNYEERRLGAIKRFETAQNPKQEFIPTQFIDFDFETIATYVKYVEQEAKKAKISPDSLRIYLGNYGKDGKNANRNTVFMLPTAEINGENGGFFINAKGEAALIRKYWPNHNNGDKQKSKAGFLPSFSPSMYQDGSLILNDGHLAPPPYGDF